LLDLVSVIPFETMINVSNVNRLARFARIGKIYKVIRMMKMVRLIKVAKVRNQLVKNLQEILKIEEGIERSIFLMMVFLVLVHVSSCFW
jgi:hypothetical protein